MVFLDKKHRESVNEITRLWSALEELSALAATHGILDIFQDNGAKTLQQMIVLNFSNIKGREGNDGRDENGTEWEMKSANAELVSGFSTHHHLNPIILKKYRSVPWSFAIYKHTHLNEIFVLHPMQLEPQFKKWESRLDGTSRNSIGTLLPRVDSLNNPKIPISFVREIGTKVFPFPTPPTNPAEIPKINRVRASGT